MRARAILFAVLVLSLAFGAFRPAVALGACSSSGVPALETDPHDYHPSIPVVFVASGLACGETYSVGVTRADGSTFSLSLGADDTGSGTATTVFDGQAGNYLAELRDAAGVVVATAVYHGSHFRYGHLTWRPTGTRAAEFVLTNAFRRSSYAAIGVTPTRQPIVGDFFEEFVGATSLIFGDGAATGTLIYETLAFDATEDWVVGRAVVSNTNPTNITHTYSTNGPFTAMIDSAARIAALANSNGVYRVQSIVRFDVADSSPVSGLPPIVNAPINTPGFSFLVPAGDTDADALSFRLATAAESGITNPIGPAGGADAPHDLTVNAATGVVSWDTTGTTAGQLYTTQIVIEESRGGTIIGRSAVDFLLKMVTTVGSPPTCTLNPPTTVYTVSSGQNVSFTVTGADPDVGQTVTINTSGLPPRATMTPGLPLTGASPQTSTFSFTPTPAQQGSAFVIVFTVTDDTGLAAQCAVTINVTVVGPPAALALTPKTDTNTVGTQHCVTATVTDANAHPSPGITVNFSVTGVNSPPSTSAPTDNSGQASSCYTGTVTGTDTISAFADTNKNGAKDTGEPSDTATKIWTAGAPATLALAPKTDTNIVGKQHCVTATVKDSLANPTPGITVLFSVSGANPQPNASAPTDTSGQASSCYTGTVTGNDSISAFADTNNNGVKDTGEPSDTATKTWTAGAPATLTLSPKTDTNPVDSQHCVTATVRDSFGNLVPGVTVRFAVAGSINTSGSAMTTTGGQATFCYMGPALPGADAIKAYADTNMNNVQDLGEPSDPATKTWATLVSNCEIKVNNAGWFIADNGDRVSFGGMAKSDGAGNASGNEEYQDHGSAQRFNLHGDPLAGFCRSDTAVTIYCMATIDGSRSHIFRIDVTDNGEPGGDDHYRIRVDAYDSGDHLLEGGNVQIHGR